MHKQFHQRNFDFLIATRDFTLCRSSCEISPYCSFVLSITYLESIGGFSSHVSLNTLRPRQNGRHFADDIFKCIFVNENIWIPINISLKFVSKVPISNVPAPVQLMAWRRSGDKPLSEPVMVSLPTHICATRPQWVNVMTQIFAPDMYGNTVWWKWNLWKITG